MRSIETILNEGIPKARERAPKKTLHEEIVQMLKEDKERLESEVRALRQRMLSYDQKEARRARETKAAMDQADVLLEAVTELARVVTNKQRAEREVRERVRKLLETHGIPPPVTLGSSRNRKKAGSRKSGTTEST
jgi:hypothetical protein